MTVMSNLYLEGFSGNKNSHFYKEKEPCMSNEVISFLLLYNI